MTFDSIVSDPQGGVMVELFELRSGLSVSRFTTSRATTTFQGAAFLPAPIKRGDLSAQGNGVSSVNIQAPPTGELTRYITSYPTLPTTVRVWSLFEEAPDDFRLIFSGRVLSVTLKDNVATARCESGSSALKTQVPKWVFSSYCQHNLFDAGCGLDVAAYRTALGEISQDGAALVDGSGAAGTKPADWFTGGYVQAGGEFRMVTKHEGNTLHLQVPLPLSALGQNVYAFPSCDKSAETCRDKFNNLRPAGNKGFLGMPTIPSSNPVIWGFR